MSAAFYFFCLACIFGTALVYLKLKYDALLKSKSSFNNIDIKGDYNNVNSSGNYTSNRTTTSKNFSFDFTDEPFKNDIETGNDIAGGFIKINGKVVESGLHGNIKVEIKGDVNKVNCTHLYVTGNVNDKIDATHVSIIGNSLNAGKINCAHFKADGDVSSDSIDATHVDIKGNVTAINIKGVHVKTGPKL